MELQITVTQEIEKDYDGIDETTKHVISTIDGKSTQLLTIEEDTVSDEICKTNHKTELTDLGFVWDTEI